MEYWEPFFLAVTHKDTHTAGAFLLSFPWNIIKLPFHALGGLVLLCMCAYLHPMARVLSIFMIIGPRGIAPYVPMQP